VTVLAAGAFAGAITRRVEDGSPVALLALCGRPGSVRASRNGRRFVVDLVRAGDVLMHEPNEDVYAVGLLSDPRDGAEASERHVRSALCRIARTLGEDIGRPFESAFAWVVDPVSPRTLRRILDEALRRAERRRELAGIAHELRSPLTSIRGQLELLLEPRGDVPARMQCLETARGEVLRLNRLLDGMADVSLLDGGALGTAASCDVAPAIEYAVAAVRPRALAKCVLVRITHRARGTARVAADDCIRASVNLLQNAIDVGARTVHVASSCSGDRIAVTIDDDGPGVDPHERRAIFECERRGRAGSTYAGTGFGLAAVAAIVRSCAGGVSVRPSRLGGARFALWFQRT
jgi:signal transduction histidine kinase